MFGPTFIDLTIKLNTDYEKVAVAISGRAVGLFPGCVLGAVLIDKLGSYCHVVIALCLDVAGIVTVAVPWCPNIDIVWFLCFIGGIVESIVNVGKFEILLDDKNLDLYKLKPFADDNSKGDKTKEICFSKGRKLGGERRKCWLLAFLAHLSTTCSRGAFRVVVCPSCVVNNFFKHLLHLNRWANLDQTWQECFMGGLLQKLCTEFDSIKNSGCHGNETDFFKQFFKNLLL